MSRFRVALQLSDGSRIERDIEGLLVGPVFSQVRNDRDFFEKVHVQDGTLVWPNGADLCPDTLIWGGAPPKDEAECTPAVELRFAS